MDHNNGDFPVFESGALMMYLCDRYGDGSLLPKDNEKERFEVISWLMFQMVRNSDQSHVCCPRAVTCLECKTGPWRTARVVVVSALG